MEGHISLSETAEQNLSFAIQCVQLPRAKKTAAVWESEGGRGEASVNEFTLSMFECLSPGCGSADRQGAMGPRLPKRDAD